MNFKNTLFSFCNSLYLEDSKQIQFFEGFDKIENKQTFINEYFNVYFDIYFFLPEIFFFSFILLSLIFGVFLKRKEKNINVFINMNLLNIFFLILLYYNFDISYYNCFQGLFHMGSLIYFFKLFICLIYFFVLFLFIYVKKFFNIFEYIILLNVTVFGMLLFISSNDIISFYLTLEMQTLPLFLVAALSIDRYNTGHAEVGIKYYILGAISSILLLFGLVILYSSTGLTNFNDLNFYFTFYDYSNYIFISFVFILSGLFFKIGLAPFHSWLPDVYSGVSLLTMGCFALLPKISIFAGIINLFNNFLNLWFLNGFSSWYYIFLAFSLLSIMLGSFGALSQVSLKKLFAYSAISHAGYLTLILFLYYENIFILEIFILYLIIYILLSFNLFYILTLLKKKNNIKQLKNINDLRGLSQFNLGLSIHLSITLFSLAGVPPLAGFFSKILLIQYLIEYDLFFVIFLIVFTSLISAYYYLRIIVLMFFYKQSNKVFLIEPSLTISFFISLISVFNISILFFFDFFLEIIRKFI